MKTMMRKANFNSFYDWNEHAIMYTSVQVDKLTHSIYYIIFIAVTCNQPIEIFCKVYNKQLLLRWHLY